MYARIPDTLSHLAPHLVLKGVLGELAVTSSAKIRIGSIMEHSLAQRAKFSQIGVSSSLESQCKHPFDSTNMIYVGHKP